MRCKYNGTRDVTLNNVYKRILRIVRVRVVIYILYLRVYCMYNNVRARGFYGLEILRRESAARECSAVCCLNAGKYIN